MPQLAQFIKAWAEQIGVTSTSSIETPTKYYGSAVYGTSDWLDGEMSMVDYGARSTPNLFLEAPLQTHNTKTGAGAWNAARFNDPTYDKLSKEYVAATDLSSQRALAKQIETSSSTRRPIIYPYFYNYLARPRRTSRASTRRPSASSSSGTHRGLKT